MDCITKINDFVDAVSYDESLAALLKTVMDQQLSEEPTPRNYYNVTDLTNPAQTYFSRACPDIKKSPELARKLARGKLLHNLASIWFRSIPNFIVEEGTIDGIYVGVPGVRGRIDLRVGDSICELKTKDNTPETPEEVISFYPQDLEQLSFYSVMHPSLPKLNYLIFMKNSPPFNLKAFRVETKEPGTIKSILIKRIDAISKAIENQDPSRLGRCRYYDSGCQFHNSNSCTCDGLEPINIDALQRSLTINFDEIFTNKLEELRDESGNLEHFPLTTRDIIVPRKHYMEVVSGLESEYSGDEKDEYKACLWASMNILKKHLNGNLSQPERQSLFETQRESRLHIGFRWMKHLSSMYPEGKITPYLLAVSLSRNPRSPSSYHLAELGIICATYGKSKGFIFSVYPRRDKLVRVFQVTYGNVEGLQRIVKRSIDRLEEAEENEDLLSLPPCPSWMNDGGKCPLMRECHSQKGCGCTP